jgi:4-amino-4-deoxy-L-arabinose transferase-like glycosyltransferase
MLLCLTALGGFLRFWRLDFQTYWTDETSTIVKIRGSFEYMLMRLSDQGFPPGWYAMLRWWCLEFEHYTGSGAFAFSPIVTRSLTALLGTLTVPAMYFLGRQFTDRKGALLVMLLTAVNPYLIYYARDIKMYAAMWFFVVLHLALFFKWQTTHRHWLWWPLVVMTGFLMTAMQSMAWFIVGLELLFLLTRPRLKSLDGPLWLLGVGVMALLPTYWYLNRTQWVDRVVEQGSDGGLAWITNYTNMSWKTLAGLPTTHLLGYAWPVYPDDAHLARVNTWMYALFHPFNTAYPADMDKADWDRVKDWFELGGPDFDKHLATRSWEWMANAQVDVAVVVFAILLLGLIPWRGIRRSEERTASVTCGRWWWVGLWILVPATVLALTWIPETSPWHRWVWHNFDPPQIWEPRYLGMIVPAWILWLAASLRRLPTWPVRMLAILFVVAVSVFSALSNFLVLRNAPYQRPAEIAMRYYDRNDKQSLAVGNPATAYPQESEAITYTLAAGVRPTPEWTPILAEEHWHRFIHSPNDAANFVVHMHTQPTVNTIILTDRYGDITDPQDILSNDSLAKRLGPHWKLAEEETYRWHYEWRFYIFHTWRTRVWVRTAPDTAPAATRGATRPSHVTSAKTGSPPPPRGRSPHESATPSTRPSAPMPPSPSPRSIHQSTTLPAPSPL